MLSSPANSVLDNRVIGYVFPGQGAQRPAMLSPWLTDPHSAAWAHEFSDVLDFNLLDAGTVWDADRIADTAITQPLLTATSLISYQAGMCAQTTNFSYDDAATSASPWPAVSEFLAPPPGDALAAGHSVGELAAAAVVGIITPKAAVYLAGKRGAAMARAASASPTSMAAIVGKIDKDALAEHLAAAGLTVANDNSSTQVVAAGPADAIASLVAAPPRGLRVIALKVAGAFHTEAMASAQEDFAAALTEVEIRDPHTPILSNADGRVIECGLTYMRTLTEQITRPVRWHGCMLTMGTQLGVDSAVELAPAGVLAGLIKRELKIPVATWNTPDDLTPAHADPTHEKDSNGR